MPSRFRLSSPRLRAAAVVTAALLAPPLAAAPAHAGTFPGEAVVSGAIPALGNIDLAPDGSGAVTYLLAEGDGTHAYVSRLVDGRWFSPERVDGGQPGGSSQPVVSTGDGGRVQVAWVNGGNIYTATRANGGAAWAQQTVWGGGGASDPHIDLSVNRKGYLVFAAPGAGGHDIRIAYSKDAAPWALVDAPLDANPANDAGVGGGRARVGASADGVAVVAWGEAGQVIARRVMGTRPSTVFANANDGLQVEGLGVGGADQPEVGVQDDDSFTGIVFRAVFTINGAERSRVVYRRLRGSRFDGPAAVDATPFATGQSSVRPHISNGGIGQGIVLGSSDTTNLSYAMLMRADLLAGPIQQVDSVAQSSGPTYAVPATATPLKMIVAWQYTGADGATDVRGRFYNGRDFEAETVLSQPGLGPTDAVRGLDAAGDDNGDLAIAYVQGNSIAVATIDQPPGRFAPAPSARKWERTDRPALAWTRSREGWGLAYKVSVDGAEVATTPRLSYKLKSSLAQGEHSWQITAVDRRGQTAQTRVGTVRVDTVAPTASVRVSGARRPGATLKLALRAVDAAPAPAPGVRTARTSGVASAIVDWGDKSRREPIKRGAQHTYARAGRYTVLVTVLDAAGNRTVTRTPLTLVTPKPRRGRGRRGDARVTRR
ncbi:PKD domain-containing protein [Conexibacter sp. JD483]|uniref:PKD domain-containing protein n=1 Tax=unclassified Conexibacter TaxID=2627773 RepID=UPI002722F7DF|nr:MULTISPECIES: PKD domain-containing protein [unclassified Conexibacter]MDO8184705.1 PKD domain-containing protein [Conexibacter sp. CPCC 205706]MDO8198011.1 PKD domain-containing protein [Conexibacter sp. CPCC 205762]MDR9368441.1 PKD domain-containing protein [Conexibacter sp. JD483]